MCLPSPPIDDFNYRAWHFITSFIYILIQIYVGQKARDSQLRVMVLEEFLHSIKRLIPEIYLVLVKKNNEGL